MMIDAREQVLLIDNIDRDRLGEFRLARQHVLGDIELLANLGDEFFGLCVHDPHLGCVVMVDIGTMVLWIEGDGVRLAAQLHLARFGQGFGVNDDERQLKKNLVKAIRRVAAKLGNTPTVCRSSYIHPTIIKAYMTGVVIDLIAPRWRKGP